MIYSPKWDLRFLELADLVASWSKDPSSKIGAVVVRHDRTIASLGFNGFPRGMNDDPARYADRDFKIAAVLHAEENALLSSRDQSLEGCTLYVSGLPPCASCASKIIQSGIARVVARHNMVPARWVQNMSWALENMVDAGLVVDTYDGHTGIWRNIVRPSDLWLEVVEGDEPAAQACACAA